MCTARGDLSYALNLLVILRGCSGPILPHKHIHYTLSLILTESAEHKEPGDKVRFGAVGEGAEDQGSGNLPLSRDIWVSAERNMWPAIRIRAGAGRRQVPCSRRIAYATITHNSLYPRSNVAINYNSLHGVCITMPTAACYLLVELV